MSYDYRPAKLVFLVACRDEGALDQLFATPKYILDNVLNEDLNISEVSEATLGHGSARYLLSTSLRNICGSRLLLLLLDACCGTVVVVVLNETGPLVAREARSPGVAVGLEFLC